MKKLLLLLLALTTVVQAADNTMTLQSFGVRGDGVTDDTTAMRAAFSQAKTTLVGGSRNVGGIVTPLTIKVTGAIDFTDGTQFDGQGCTITNTSTNFTFRYLTALTGKRDIESTIDLKNFTIRAKNGIQVNQQGDNATVFDMEATVMRGKLNHILFYGAYQESVDPNYTNQVTLTDAQMKSFGIGFYATQILGWEISNCLIQSFGCGVYLDGSDQNLIETANRLAYNARHVNLIGRVTGTGAWGGGNRISGNDILQNKRLGGVALFDNMNTEIRNNFFEPGFYDSSGVHIITARDFDTQITGNQMINTRLGTNTPIIRAEPYYGLSVHGNFRTPNGYDAVGTVLPTYWTPNQQVLSIWGDNATFFPQCTNAGVFGSAQVNPYLFCATNYTIMQGLGAQTFPWTPDPFTGYYTLQTNTSAVITRLPLAQKSDRAFIAKFTGRGLGVSSYGFYTADYIETGFPTTRIGQGILGFYNASTNTESRYANWIIPRAALGSGYIELTLFNQQVQWQQVSISPYSVDVQPYNLSYTNSQQAFITSNGVFIANPWTLDPHTQRYALTTNNQPLTFNWGLQSPADTNLTFVYVGRPTGTGAGFATIRYRENGATRTLFSDFLGFPAAAGTNTIALTQTLPFSLFETNTYNGTIELEIFNNQVQLESINIIPYHPSLSLTLTNLNVTWLSVSNSVIWYGAADGPSAAEIGAGHGALWVTNTTGTLFYRWTADGLSATDTPIVTP